MAISSVVISIAIILEFQDQDYRGFTPFLKLNTTAMLTDIVNS
jgi:hypothetical protein